MKIIIPSLSLFLGFSLLISCNKENSESPYANDSVPKIQKISEYYNGSLQRETSLAYDASARLVKVNYYEAYDGDKFYDTLIYTTSTITITTYNSKNKFIEEEVFSLNSDNLATLMTDTLDDNTPQAKRKLKFFSILEHESNTYGYDDSGYQTLEITSNEFGGTHRYDKTYSNGNLISSIYQYMANDTVILNGNSTYTYYLDKTNSIGNLNRGIPFMGKQNNNLLLSISDQKWQTSTDTVKISSSYKYEFDSRKRVVKQYITPQNGENQDVTYLIYTYR